MNVNILEKKILTTQSNEVSGAVVNFPHVHSAHSSSAAFKKDLTHPITLHPERDKFLTVFGKETLEDRYLLEGESYQDLFRRVAEAYADDSVHAARLYEYMSKLWFMPATPILSNGGAKRGLPISCFLNTVPDSLDGIVSTWNENVFLSSNGGGIGTYWGFVRGVGETIKNAGKTSGIIPFIRVMDSLTLAISQGSLRRGSAAVYLDIDHPEIEEFLEIRKPSGDFNRKSLNLHHAVNLTDAFMESVEKDTDFPLRSPHDRSVVRTVNARLLFQKILELRLQTGEPYLIFIDTANKALAPHQRALGLKVRLSNLCSEILLATGPDHKGTERTAVCCLSSVNVEKWDEWHSHPTFLEDIFRFLDNVLQEFIDTAPSKLENARYSAERERSVGLGIMGFHAFLQSKNVPFESALAKAWNMKMIRHLRFNADKVSEFLAVERGACPDAHEVGIMERFSHKLAIAPTASISIICGGTSAGIEPIPANVYTHKTLNGNYEVRNPHLEKLLESKGLNTPTLWQSILANEGSVQHLDCLTEDEKQVFKTAFEIDQRWVIDLAADRAPYICQSQSVNLFLPADIHKADLLHLHWRAWKKGLKSLYYCRSKSIQRAAYAGVEGLGAVTLPGQSNAYEECLSCQ